VRTILVTQRLVEEADYAETREALDVRWGRFFAALNLLPVPMSYDVDPSEYAALDPAGVVLTGGNDVAACSDSPFAKQRDAYERCVLMAAGMHDWPIFAVCRGLQFLAAEVGATMRAVTGHVGADHGLATVVGTPFASLLGDVHSVNSFHRYAPDGALARGWKVCARGDGGDVEAIAHDSLRALGVMWHPERYPTPRPCDLALVRAVVGS
jgi:N5-(cytidine 5'-diphosphoramidyl)-L-glutamine hydrolase